jgi:hypothetical protein
LDPDECENIVLELGIDLPIGCAATGIGSAPFAAETLSFERQSKNEEKDESDEGR